MYIWILSLHNLLRWLVVIGGVLAFGGALWGWFGKRDWTRLDDGLGLIFAVGLDVQVLIGLLLYFIFSPLTTAALQNISAVLQDSTLMFFVVEHGVTMLAALALAHAGRALTKKAAHAAGKHQRAAIFFGLALLAIFVAMPWGRPLNPFHWLAG